MQMPTGHRLMDLVVSPYSLRGYLNMSSLRLREGVESQCAVKLAALCESDDVR